MNVLWGCVTVAIGLIMFIWGLRKSEFIIYRILVARSKILWGENVHKFYQVVGIMIIVFGILLVRGYIPMK
ncbi:MAG: hypothetical protein DRI44_02225 [Chlamydiae bacterium]|nr:MAG: hypothetical protein DRI44_02225 [Chlamydiota bacterium]